jgi:hypothetical protein
MNEKIHGAVKELSQIDLIRCVILRLFHEPQNGKCLKCPKVR